jgi:hypothetical protein
MNLKISIVLISLFPFIGFAKENQCAPRKNELIKYVCPAYVKNNSATGIAAQDGWMPEGYTLNSKNSLQNISVSYGDDLAPSKEGILRGSSGTTKLNSGHAVYLPSIKNGKWVPSTETYYLQCHYKNTDVVLYKKIDKEARVCDIQFKKIKTQPSKIIPTGVAICSTAENYIDKTIEPSDCLIGQSVNK